MLRFFGGNHHIIKNVAVLVKICEVVVNVFEIAQIAFTIVLVLPAHKSLACFSWPYRTDWCSMSSCSMEAFV